VKHADALTRIREGLELKHFGETDVPQWKRDRVWEWAYGSASESCSTSEEIEIIKRSYKSLVELVLS
jgi:hypothetical protein